MKNSKFLKAALLFFGLFILIMFLFSIDLNQLKAGINQLDIFSVSIVLLLTFVNVFVKAYRWQFLVRRITKQKISLPFSFSSIIAGVAAGSFTPGRGGEIAKPLMLKARHGIRVSKSLPGIIIERMFDLAALMALFFFALIYVPKNAIYTQAVIGFSIMIVLLFVLLIIAPEKMFTMISFVLNKSPIPKNFKEKLDSILTEFFKGFKILRSKKATTTISILSLLSMILEVVRLYFLFMIFGIPISIILTTFSFTASIIFGTLTMIPGGIGTTEISQAAIINNIVRVTNLDFLKDAILVDRFISYYLLIILGALILMLMKHEKKTLK